MNLLCKPYFIFIFPSVLYPVLYLIFPSTLYNPSYMSSFFSFKHPLIQFSISSLLTLPYSIISFTLLPVLDFQYFSTFWTGLYLISPLIVSELVLQNSCRNLDKTPRPGYISYRSWYISYMFIESEDLYTNNTYGN